MKKFIFALFALSAVSACVSSSEYYGKGPVTLSPRVQAHFDEYLTKNPGVFLITQDGTGVYYRYCPDVGNCRTESLNVGLYNCEKGYGEKCYVYAVGKDIVWKFDEDPTQTAQ